MKEVRIEDEIHVNASQVAAWNAIMDPTTHAAWHPFVIDIHGEHRLGEIRTCSVIVGRKTGQTKECCVEEKRGSRIIWAIEEDSTGFGRLVSDWHAGFALAPRDDTTIVTAISSFRPSNVLVRVMLPIIRRKFHQTQRTILNGLRESLETPSATTVLPEVND